MSRGLQTNLSKDWPILLDEAHKGAKVSKMLAVLGHAGAFSGEKENLVSLDVGCSGGFFAEGLATHVGTSIGVDIDFGALLFAKGRQHSVNSVYVCAG
jgi:2-polyprenyl-3-methyl-5-hydroxy-6-metoxy-1,4-benzoquinol methylase